jgi:hypothetical protein
VVHSLRRATIARTTAKKRTKRVLSKDISDKSIHLSMVKGTWAGSFYTGKISDVNFFTSP